ncbi:MAG: methyltransferase domain-containing protein [Coprobacillaceae bacterium]
MHKLACPKCHQALSLQGNSYYCENKHCYDLSKSKYINLLLNPDKATNNPGDSKESLIARKSYLNQGYYDGIVNTVIDIIKKYQTSNTMQILDIGCGEGYYTHKFKQALGDTHCYYGLDISKEAIHMATRYTKDIYWLVGNSKNLPVTDHSMDFLLALFTVVNQEELKRALHENGYIIHVTANPKHLIEIKELIYDEIKIKSDKYIRLDFPVVESYDFIQEVTINNHEDALNLLKMTPHYYHIKSEKRDVLQTIKNINITIDIKITVYQTSLT